MINHAKMAQLVNLNPNGENRVFDIYSALLNIVNNKLSKNNNPKLKSVILTREQIKRPIMTINYSVTNVGVTNQLADQAISRVNKEYAFKTIKNGLVLLNYKDLFDISKIIINTYKNYDDDLHSLWVYFNNIASLFAKLKIPVTWIAPQGISVEQRYIKTKKYEHKYKTYRITKKITFEHPIKPFILDSKANKSAAIPNIIHSLDAAMVHQAINEFKYTILTIHDCFIIGANHGNQLRNLIKTLFVANYITSNYLKTFHTEIIRQLQLLAPNAVNLNNNTITLYNPKTMIDEVFPIPTLPKRGKLTASKVLQSVYHIN
jgi:DNA-directed RNA polymerase